MDKFERLNQETRDFNNKNVNRFNYSSHDSSQSWIHYHNNQTFKQNNGQYSKHYY